MSTVQGNESMVDNLDLEMQSITINDWESIIVKEFQTALEKDYKPDPLMCWSAPGLGKTSGVNAAAKRLSEILDEEVKVICIMSSCYEPCDITGIPFEDGKNKEYCTYKPLEWAWRLSTEADYQGPMILFLDDLPVAHPQTQAACFKVVHEYMVGSLTLRKNVLILGAGNRVEDASGAHDMLKALANRFRHYYARLDVDSWLDWAIRRGGVHPMAVAFIKCHQDKLHIFDPANPEHAFPSPRSWEMAGRAIDMWGTGATNADMLFKAMSGTVGCGTSKEFTAFLNRTKFAIAPEEIIKDPLNCTIPNREDLDAVHATITSLQVYLNNHPDDCLKAIQYVMRDGFLEEQAIVLAMHISWVLEKLDRKKKMETMTTPIFGEFINKYAQFILA